MEKVEVFYTISVEKKAMIPENAIKDWEDEQEIKTYIGDKLELNDNDIEIVSIG